MQYRQIYIIKGDIITDNVAASKRFGTLDYIISLPFGVITLVNCGLQLESSIN